MNRRYALCAALAFASLVVARSATAGGSTCSADGRPWVRILTEDVPGALLPFVRLLRAELASRGLALCTSEDSATAPPVATIRVAARPDAVALTVEVRDAVTDKQVSRDVALTGVPPDSQPLTLAVAADELLRASWAELMLRTAPPPARPVPPEVVQTVRDVAAPAQAPLSVQFGIGFVWEQYSRGMTLYGADGRLGAWLTRRLEVALQFGLRNGPTASATDGTVQPSAWSLSTAAIFTFTPPEARWGLDGVASVGVERLTLVPAPRGAATGSEMSGYAALVNLGPQGWFAVLPALRIGAEVLGSLPVRGVEATDDGARFVGLSGLGWTLQLGVWSAF